MESIKEMVDVNTIVGDAVQAPDGTVIIPISKVTFGFAAGGGEYSKCCAPKSSEDGDGNMASFPFAGGSGAGVSINPVAFMVVGQGQIKLLPVDTNSSLDKLLDMIPNLIQKADEALKMKMSEGKKKDNNKNNGNNNDEGSNNKKTEGASKNAKGDEE